MAPAIDRGGWRRLLTFRISWRAAAVAILLALDLGWGLALVFRAPPFVGLDEPNHWIRAQQVSEFHPFARRLGENNWGGKVDLRAVTLTTDFALLYAHGDPLRRSQSKSLVHSVDTGRVHTAIVSFPSTASFSPLAYIPSALGIAVSRGLGLGLLAQCHAGRLGNLLAYLALVAATVWALPAGRLAALAMLSFPTAIGLAASISADPVNTGWTALFIACCLRLRFRGEAPDAAEAAWLALLCLGLGLLKMTVCVFAGAVLLVPGRVPQRYLLATVLLAGCAGLALAWNIAYPFVPGPYWHTGADPSRAIAVLLADPLGSAQRTLQNMNYNAGFFFRDSYGRFGGALGPFHFIVGATWCWIGLAGTVGLAATSRIARARPWASALLAGLGIFYLAALVLAFRIAFNPPASDLLLGEQGRYLHLTELSLVLALVLAAPFASLYRQRSGAVRAGAAMVSYALMLGAQSAAMAEALSRYGTLWR